MCLIFSNTIRHLFGVIVSHYMEHLSKQDVKLFSFFCARLWVLIKCDIMSSWISAVGKSTFARLLQSACPDWEVMAEPVSKWQNIESGTKKVVHISWAFICVCKKENNEAKLTISACVLWQGKDDSPQTTVSNLLQMMYQDPKRWSYTFQTYSCMSRLRTQLQPPPARLLSSEGTPVQVYERSVYSDRWASQDSETQIKSGELQFWVLKVEDLLSWR